MKKVTLANLPIGVKIIGFSLTVIFFVLCIASYNAIKRVKEQKKLLIKNEIEKINNLQRSIDILGKQYLTTAIAIAEQEITKKALREKNREILIPKAKSLFSKINKNSPEPLKIHYHQIPGYSFLRVWKPEKYGDDLRSFRHTVVQVQKTGRPLSGIEAGRAGLAIRGIAPVIDNNGKILGSVEVFSSINTYAKRIADPGKKDFAIFRRELVKTFKDDQSIKIGNYKLIYSTNKKLFEPILNESFLKSSEDKINIAKKGNILYLSGPIHDYSGKTTGIWITGLNLSNFIKAQNKIIYHNIIYTIILAIIAGILIYWYTKNNILKPMQACLQCIDEIADGNLNTKVEIKNKDEIGKLAKGINHMIENLKNLAKKANYSTKNIEKTEEKISSACNELLNISLEAKEKVNILFKASQENKERITQLASANEEITVTVQNTSQNVENTAKMLQQVTEEVENAINVISQLNKHFAKIEEVVSFISKIADQTNLLALNATIEAARAGEAGKGFAVVANEVKELAKQTANATDKIVNNIQNLRNLVEGSVDAIHKVDNMINPLKELSENMASAMEQTAHATQEISLQSQEVSNSTLESLNSFKEIEKAIEKVGEAAYKSHETIQELKRLSKELQDTITKFKF